MDEDGAVRWTGCWIIWGRSGGEVVDLGGMGFFGYGEFLGGKFLKGIVGFLRREACPFEERTVFVVGCSFHLGIILNDLSCLKRRLCT